MRPCPEALSYVSRSASKLELVKVDLYSAPTSLPGTFVVDKQQGLFTRKALPAGIVFLEVDPTGLCLMNDPLVNLTEFFLAKDSTAVYQAWTNLARHYYQLDRMKDRVNVVMVHWRGKLYYQTLKAIPANGELLRAYGFTSWLAELTEFITTETGPGWLKFIKELLPSLTTDPLCPLIGELHDQLAADFS